MLVYNTPCPCLLYNRSPKLKRKMREKDHANIPFVPCELHGWDWGHPRKTEIVKELKTA